MRIGTGTYIPVNALLFQLLYASLLTSQYIASLSCGVNMSRQVASQLASSNPTSDFYSPAKPGDLPAIKAPEAESMHQAYTTKLSIDGKIAIDSEQCQEPRKTGMVPEMTYAASAVVFLTPIVLFLARCR